MSETMAQGRAEVDEANRRFMEGFERGDAASVAALYTEDAVALPPDVPMISGRAEIEEFWRGQMAAGVRRIDLAPLRLAGSGDVLHEVGRATITFQPEGGEAITLTGKYVVVWERDPAGGLALAVDMWNGESAG
jgi:ketosteroid isomerase-like protein